MKAAFRYIAVPEEAYRIAGPHRIIPMDLWAMAHGSRLRTVRVTERQWEPEVSRRHARTVLSDFVTAGLLLVAERGDRGSVYRVVDASTGTFGEGQEVRSPRQRRRVRVRMYHSAYHNADHNCSEPTSAPDTNADRIADHARVDPRARPTIPYLTLPSDQGELRVETPSTEVAIVALAEPAAAPAALGPADPASDEPDWDALPAVPMTYDEADDEAAEDEGPVGGSASPDCVAPHYPPVEGGEVAPVADAVPREVDADVRGDGPARPCAVLTGDGCLPLATATQPPPATRANVLRCGVDVVQVELLPAPKSGADARCGIDSAPGAGVIAQPRAASTTRATDVDALWEAWRSYGTVRGKPNAHRKAAMTRVLRDYPLADLLEMLDAAHNGDGDKWRWLQGATSRSNAVYLRPENLLRPSTIAGRMDDAHDWVAAGRPKHNAAEARVEARAEAVARPAKARALEAWELVPQFVGLSLDQAKLHMAKWREENQRAMLAGLDAVGGLSTLGRLDSFARARRRGDFVRGVVEALGGRLTEAELREVG